MSQLSSNSKASALNHSISGLRKALSFLHFEFRVHQDFQSIYSLISRTVWVCLTPKPRLVSPYWAVSTLRLLVPPWHPVGAVGSSSPIPPLLTREACLPRHVTSHTACPRLNPSPSLHPTVIYCSACPLCQSSATNLFIK